MSIKIMSMVFDAIIPDTKITIGEGDHTVTQPTMKFVLLALADYASDTGESIYPSIETMTRKTGLSDRSVQRALDALENLGMIEDNGFSKWHTKSYSINVKELMSYMGDPESPHEVTQSHVGGDPESPNPSLNHHIKLASKNQDSVRSRRTDAKVKGDLFDGMMAYSNMTRDLSWMPEYLLPLAEAFIEASGITPTKADRKSWISWIDEQHNMQIQPDQVRRAVVKLLKDGMTIGGPMSVTKTARSLKSVKQEVFAEEYR